MSKARIVKRTDPAGRVTYVIQQPHFFFRWRWVDAWINSIGGANCKDYFDTLDEAKAHLPYFDGTPTVTEVVE